jgi:uncharacterized phage protein (TIGR02216 family)
MNTARILQPFPWEQAIGFGLGILRLPPEQFWKMTPRELAHALRAVYGNATPLDRVALTDLMTRYPDGR